MSTRPLLGGSSATPHSMPQRPPTEPRRSGAVTHSVCVVQHWLATRNHSKLKSRRRQGEGVDNDDQGRRGEAAAEPAAVLTSCCCRAPQCRRWSRRPSSRARSRTSPAPRAAWGAWRRDASAGATAGSRRGVRRWHPATAPRRDAVCTTAQVNCNAPSCCLPWGT